MVKFGDMRGMNRPGMGMRGMGRPGISPRVGAIGAQLGAAGGAPAYSAPPQQANLTAMANSLPMAAPAAMKKGGMAKSASSRADGIAQRGKTKGKIV